jgi:hypothetical protein
VTIIVDRPCYCTREQVKRATDIRLSAYANDRVDRAICAAADAVEALCNRQFYTQYTTRYWDWPNFQYSYPWRLWLDRYELAGPPTLVTTGSLLPVPIVIPTSAIICQPINEGPPFTRIELRRDLNYAFGYNTTPQLDIAITGPFGYWMNTRAAGTAAASIGTSDSTVLASDGISVGVGDVLIVDSESMIVTDATFSDTGIGFSGLSTASAADNVITVPGGADFMVGEVLQVDEEWMLVQAVNGNVLTIKRAWDGSVLTAHTGGTLWARRTLAVLRGQLGTMPAAHVLGAALAVSAVPDLIRQLAVAEAELWLTLEPGAYSQATGGLGSQSGLGVTVGGSPNARNVVKEGVPGLGLPTLRDQVVNSKLCRKARSRAI